MGACCAKLESIEHANSTDDIKYIIKTDIEFYNGQFRRIINDKVNKEHLYLIVGFE